MPNQSKKQCFVVMSFDEKSDEIFDFAIQPAANSKHYSCIRMDKVAGTLNLIHEMIHNIYVSEVIVADLTGQSANVFYELGMAHSVPVPNKTIMISEQNEEIPFDIGSFQVLKYKRTFKGITDLRNGIAKRIEFIETRRDLTSNPVQDYLLKEKNRPKLSGFHKQKKSGSDEEIFDKLYLSQIYVSLLLFLNTLPEEKSKLSITKICNSLNIQKRKFAVDVLYQLETDGLIEKEKRNRNAYWHISNKGRQMLKKLGEMIDLG